MNNQDTISSINSPIEVNNDRIEGYMTAAKETEEDELKRLFDQFAETSRKFNSDLIFEVHKLGGTPNEGSSTLGKFFRAWMEMKTAITDKDRTAVLRSCAYGEEMANEAYDIALSRDLDDLPSDIQSIIKDQRTTLKKDDDNITALLSMV